MSKVILITGASSGLGLETAKTLAKQGNIVYGTSRKDNLVLEGVNTLKMDVTSDKEVKATIQAITAREGRLDILINNAGIGMAGALQDFSDEESFIEINTNLLGVFRCCKYVLPQMIKQGKGTIITISSIAGIFALTYQGFYSASKFGVEALMEALRYEVSSKGINIVVVNPGDFSTGFTSSRRLPENAKKSIYAESLERTLEVIEKNETNGHDPRVFARKMGKIVKKKNPGHRYVIAVPHQKIAVMLKRILPSKIFFKILASYYKVKT